MASIRHRAGALVYDWPRFVRAMARRGGWVRFRNRNDAVSIDPATGGVRCEWRFTRDLHISNVFPWTGRALLRRSLSDWPIAFADAPAMDDEPRVSFVIGHRGEARLPLLLETIATIAAQSIPVECIVVEQSATIVAQARLPKWVRHIHTPIASDSVPYNRSWTLNTGAKAARAKLLVLHDNDFLVPVRYAAELAARHAEGCDFIDLKRFMFYLPQHDSERVMASRDLSNVTPERITQNLCGGGSIAADRDAYFDIGGFDESFVGWGGEDNDFWDRAATRRVFAHAYLPLVHLWHAPQAEKAFVQREGVPRYEELSRVPPETRIANLQHRQAPSSTSVSEND